MDEAIELIEVPELETKERENIQLSKDYKVDTAITIKICKIDHKAEGLEVDHGKVKEEAEDDNQKWVQRQYFTPY